MFVANISPLLQVAMAGPGDIRNTVVDLVREHIYTFAGDKYSVEADIMETGLSFQLAYRQPDEMKAWLEQYNLDSNRSFANTFWFVAGAIERFIESLFDAFDRTAIRHTVGELKGRIDIPTDTTLRLDYKSLLKTLLGHVRQIEARAVPEAGAPGPTLPAAGLVTGTGRMHEAWERIRRAGRSDEIVLLRGESGTGKSFIAKRIHQLSRRKDGAFIEVCMTSDVGSDNLVQSDLFGHERGAFTGAREQKQGLFFLADGGTIFLDEIGDATPEMQAKLLRVIESSTFRRLGGLRDICVDVRVIAATNRDLESMVRDGRFREDLYYRLNVIPVHLPPLRERLEDIPELAECLLQRTLDGQPELVRVLPDDVVRQLATHRWPGNIRELDHAVKHAVAMSDQEIIAWNDFPETIRSEATSNPMAVRASAPASIEPNERTALIQQTSLLAALDACDPQDPRLDTAPHEVPGHVEHAKRKVLEALIYKFNGDLNQIARFWDRRSEKTVRNAVRTYGLTEALDQARSRKNQE